MFDNDQKTQGPQHLFAKPDMGIREAEGMLAKLWRRILCDTMGDSRIYTDTNRLSRYNSLVTKWINHPRNGVSHDRNKQATLRGNINKQLVAAKMSVKVFITFMQIWRARDFELIIRPTWENGETTEHSIKFTNLLPDDPTDADAELRRDLQEMMDNEHSEPGYVDSGNWTE